MTADAGLSNRQRREQQRRLPKAARGGRTVTSAKVVQQAVETPDDKDGLRYLQSRNRLTPQQLRVAGAYRKAYRDAAVTGVTIKSGLDFQVRGTGTTPAGPAGRIIRNEEAQAQLHHMRFTVLQGQVDVLEVLDAVCGRGLSLTALASGNDRMAKCYEMVLKVALDMLAIAGVR